MASATPECTRADDDVHAVALDQLVDVVGGLGGVAFVVDLEVLDLCGRPACRPARRRSSLKPFSMAVPSAA
jgi:hypothetical protein